MAKNENSLVLVIPGIGDVLRKVEPEIVQENLADVQAVESDNTEVLNEVPEKRLTLKEGNMEILTGWLVGGESMRIEDMIPDWSSARGGGEKSGFMKAMGFAGRVAKSLAADGLVEVAKHDEEIAAAVKRGAEADDTARLVGTLLFAAGKKMARAINSSQKK